MIDVDLTLFVQMINFIITLVIVNMLLFRPVRDVVRARKQKIADITAVFNDFSERAAKELSQYEAALQSARQEGDNLCNAARDQSTAQLEEMIRNAMHSAQELISASREQARAQAESLRESLGGQIGELTDMALEKLLRQGEP
jgi:F-type H+-transporting ATPase subunit b